MNRVTQYICLPIAPLFKRVRLPFTRRTVPVWLFLSVGTPFFLFFGVGALVVTNQPIFCTSCHEMDLHYATWRQSGHQSVGCEECHVMPGAVSMFKSKINALRLVRAHAGGDIRAQAIQGHVPDSNCQRCHPETPELVTYHGLKITHRDHWKLGVECTFCHDRVVHGPKWMYTGVTSSEKVTAVMTAAKYTPTMETCYRCHDGKRAPNECSTCHVSLGERKPTVFDPAWVEAHRAEVQRTGEADCERCHTTDFCAGCHRAANPHPNDWIAQHPEQVRKSPTGCPKCHLAPAEQQPADVKKMAFCVDCHGLRQQHKQADWQQVHGKESLANPAYCQQCHTTEWCASCHSISKPHPTEWLARHSAEASRNPKSCQVCHTPQFCESCHQSKRSVPASHQNDWLARHKDSARQQGANCNTCHRPEFCQACHAKKPPANHSKLWLSQHGVMSQVQGNSCTFCHTSSFCNKCHGVIMPHPKDWVKQHPKTAAQDKTVCAQCHRKEGCETCHRGALPATHKAADWMHHHSRQAKQQSAQCALCHRKDFCKSCHGTEMPHPSDWLRDTHGKAAQKDRGSCLRCHQENDCTKCHGVTMPHPDTWVSEHGKQAEATPAKCGKCHRAGRNKCSMCHSGLAPSSHQKDSWKAQHPVAGATNLDLCELCHGKDACNSCHAAKMGKVGR